VQEIRTRDEAGVFRLFCVARIDSAVYRLHCFQNKTQRTVKSDLVLVGLKGGQPSTSVQVLSPLMPRCGAIEIAISVLSFFDMRTRG
jgi:hypothetical protein